MLALSPRSLSLSLVCWIGLAVRLNTSGFETALGGDGCPESCSALFSRLEPGSEDGELNIQNVKVRERGEPKSGTTFLSMWAIDALGFACHFLQRTYGKDSCRITGKRQTLTFEPALASSDEDQLCTCPDVQRVQITFSVTDKHKLPVDDHCRWSHRQNGLTRAGELVCRPKKGESRAETLEELLQCVKDAACPLTDDSLQVTIVRDPRPTVTSSYFHALKHGARSVAAYDSVDEYTLALLPAVCQWLNVRLHLFEERLGDKALVSWYEDVLADPYEWHERFFSFVGLNMPAFVIKEAAATAPRSGYNQHEGGAAAAATRTYKDELKVETLVEMDDILRRWLPIEILTKLDVPTE